MEQYSLLIYAAKHLKQFAQTAEQLYTLKVSPNVLQLSRECYLRGTPERD